MNETPESQNPLGPSDAQIARMRASVHATITADQVRTRRRRGWGIGGTLGLLVLLAGGTSIAMAAGVLQAPSWFTAAPAPTPSQSAPTTTTAPTPSATPTPTPTPTPVAFNLPCDQQFDPAVLASVDAGLQLQPLSDDYDVAPPTGSGVTVNSVKPLTNVAPPEAASVLAAAQSGFYTCNWINEASQGVTALRLSVLPQAESQFVEAKNGEAVGETPAPVALGDDRFLTCGESGWSGPYPSCTLNVLKNGTWVELSIVATADESDATIATDLTTLANSALSHIFAPGMLAPQPRTAASDWDAATDCSRIQTAISPQFPGLKLSAGPLDGTDAYDDVFVAAKDASGGFACWGTYQVPITVVPGLADWAWDAPYDSSVKVTALSTAGAPGLGAARFATSEDGDWVDGIIDGAIVSLPTTDPQKGLAALTEIAAAGAAG